jgi:hypothetical protein
VKGKQVNLHFIRAFLNGSKWISARTQGMCMALKNVDELNKKREIQCNNDYEINRKICFKNLAMFQLKY